MQPRLAGGGALVLRLPVGVRRAQLEAAQRPAEREAPLPGAVLAAHVQPHEVHAQVVEQRSAEPAQEAVGRPRGRVGQSRVGAQPAQQLLCVEAHSLEELLPVLVCSRVGLVVSQAHPEQQVVALDDDRLGAQPAPRHADLQPPDPALDQSDRQLQRVQRILRQPEAGWSGGRANSEAEVGAGPSAPAGAPGR